MTAAPDRDDIVERLRARHAAWLANCIEHLRADVTSFSFQHTLDQEEIESLRAKLRRDGSGCGCHWTYADEKDLDGTQDKECAYHMDQKRGFIDELTSLRARLERIRVALASTDLDWVSSAIRRELEEKQ